PRRPVVNRRQRQKSTGLAAVLGLLGLAAKLSCVKIVSKRDRHRELHGSRHRIRSFPIRESPPESPSARLGISRPSGMIRSVEMEDLGAVMFRNKSLRKSRICGNLSQMIERRVIHGDIVSN